MKCVDIMLQRIASAQPGGPVLSEGTSDLGVQFCQARQLL